MLTSAVRPKACAFEALRAREFGRLDEQGLAYLDYAASALYADSQVEALAERLRAGVFGNPHSQHAASRVSESDLHDARAATLRFLDADPDVYAVIFAANASGAMKLVGESYPFSPTRGLILSADNHNSVMGLREYARANGASVSVLPLADDLTLDEPRARLSRAAEARAPGLLAFPFRSNFSGVAHPLALIAEGRRLGYDVMLDAAGLGAAGGLSLRAHPADFVAISFYKIFGLPTGLGALVARRDALARLRRPWFSGGAVAYVSVAHDRHQLLPGHAGFEDGTPDFLAAGAVSDGFAFLDQVDRPALSDRLAGMAADLRRRFEGLRHANGAPLVTIYRPAATCGPTLTFNVLDPRGAVLPYVAVEAEAVKASIALRGGCFCNPGAGEAALGLSGPETALCLDRLGGAFTPAEFSRCLGGRPVGALRLSLGLPSVQRDLDRVVDMVSAFAEMR